jgi:hypothetical protein
LDNDLDVRSPVPPRLEGRYDVGAEQDLPFTKEPSTFDFVGSPTCSQHGSNKPPQSPTDQESHRYIGRDGSELDEEEQQEKENENATTPDDCTNIDCNEVNGSLQQAEQRRLSSWRLKQISAIRNGLISTRASQAAFHTIDKADSEGAFSKGIIGREAQHVCLWTQAAKRGAYRGLPISKAAKSLRSQQDNSPPVSIEFRG